MCAGRLLADSTALLCQQSKFPFCKNTLITSVKHSDLIRITKHATVPSPCLSLSWLICTSASTRWTAVDHLATALHSCIQNEWAGSETPLSSLPVNTPAAHFPSLSGITLCVFQFPSCLFLLCAVMSVRECVCFRIPAGLLFTQDRLTTALKWHWERGGW